VCMTCLWQEIHLITQRQTNGRLNCALMEISSFLYHHCIYKSAGWLLANKYLTTEIEGCRIKHMLTRNGTKHHFTICKSYTHCKIKRRFWRYQRGNQTMQWSKENVQKYKQRSTIHTHKTKDRVTRTPLLTGVNSGAL
jgi:hypothetical protein